jgi:hypothetical protein
VFRFGWGDYDDPYTSRDTEPTAERHGLHNLRYDELVVASGGDPAARMALLEEASRWTTCRCSHFYDEGSSWCRVTRTIS